MKTLADRFRDAAEADPDGIAVIHENRAHTFREVARMSDCYANGLRANGVRAGTRIAFMVPPGPDFFALCYAVFKIAAVPVHIDPGMDLDQLKVCLDRAEPEVFVGIPLAHQARIGFGWGERTIRLNVTVGAAGDWGGPTLAEFTDDTPFAPQAVEPDQTAMILYTTGSTGPAKGAIFTYANCDAQFQTLGALFGFRPGRRDMPTLPTIAPYTVAAGMTSVIPDMDFTRPGEVNAADIIAQITAHQVNSMFGSPALIDQLGRYGSRIGVQLPTLRRVLTAAAPVGPETLERFATMLSPEAELLVFYGATEALPVAVIDAREILAETAALWAQGAGTCVGRPLASMRTAVMPISDDPRPDWRPDDVVAAGEIGELVVTGREVSAEYSARPDANKHAKIVIPGTGEVWHRMGDAVRVDEQGRLWFQGRVTHRVQAPGAVYFTEPVEAVFNQHPKVRRTALVGIGEPGFQELVLCVELESDQPASIAERVRKELFQYGAHYPHTADIKHVLFHERFPVDIRHNSKIFREKLAVWAADQLGAACVADRANV
jgi:acyl-CoA synthetase (AMP-forming)/AMP-acid ligase II